MRHLLSPLDFSVEELDDLLALATDIEHNPDKYKEFIIDCKTDSDKIDLMTNAFLELVILSYKLDEVRQFKF